MLQVDIVENIDVGDSGGVDDDDSVGIWLKSVYRRCLSSVLQKITLLGQVCLVWYTLDNF